MISFHLNIVESVLAESMPNYCKGAARLPFEARLAYLLHVHWPVNLALFKPLPHYLEPTWEDRAAKECAAKRAGLVV
jgi:hypothetical protein